MTPGWYLRRLRAMDAAEVVWRVRAAAVQARWRTRRGENWPTPEARVRWAGGVARVLGPVPDAGSRALAEAADAVLDGSWSVFETRADVSGPRPDWLRDPATGRRAPADTYCFSVPYRDERRVGDAKHLWELSRLHHLTVLAAAFWHTGEARYAERAVRHLRSWCEANPPLCGIHWVSGIELGLRLVSWVWTRRLLDGFAGAADAFERDRVFLRQLHAHQAWIAALHGRGTSANNHLVAEMAGLLAASAAFPGFEAGEGWNRLARAALAREAERQTFPDGLNREMAAGYHVFALELFLVAGCEADAAGAPMDEGYWRGVRAMADALAATVDAGLATARQGDGDDGRVLVLDGPGDGPGGGPGPDAAPAVLEACARVVGPAAWWPGLPMRTVGACLLGGIARRRASSSGRPAARPNAFPAAGVTILRHSPPGGDEIWCRVDHGPHGYLTTAAHAHADALSFELRLGGCPVLVDPGTYRYHGEAAWRDYFRSTVAHNTLELYGRDQARHGGPFLWLTRPDAVLLSCRGLDGGDAAGVEIAHDGYAAHGAIHRREIVLDRRARALDLVDTVEAAPRGRTGTRVRDQAAEGGRIPVRLAFNLHPDVACELHEGRAELSWGASGGRRRASLALPRCLRWSVHAGETNPILGWYSARFGHKQPAPLLLGTGRVAPGQSLRSRVAFGPAGRDPAPVSAHAPTPALAPALTPAAGAPADPGATRRARTDRDPTRRGR